MAIIYTIENYGNPPRSFWTTDPNRQTEIASQLLDKNRASEVNIDSFDTEKMSDMEDGIHLKQWGYSQTVYDNDSIDAIDTALQSAYMKWPDFSRDLDSDNPYWQYTQNRIESNKLREPDMLVGPNGAAQDILENLGFFADEPFLPEQAHKERHEEQVHLEVAPVGGQVAVELSQEQKMAQLLLQQLGIYVDAAQDTIGATLASQDGSRVKEAGENVLPLISGTEKTEQSQSKDTPNREDDDFSDSEPFALDDVSDSEGGGKVFHLDEDDLGADASFMREQEEQQAEARPMREEKHTETPPAPDMEKLLREVSVQKVPRQKSEDTKDTEDISQQPSSEQRQQQHAQHLQQAAPQAQGQTMVPVSPPGLLTRLVQSLIGGLGSINMPDAAPELRQALEPSIGERLQWSRQKQAIDHMLVLEDHLETCKDQYESIRSNPYFVNAQEQVRDGDMDPKDFFLALARSSRTGGQAFQNLNTDIQQFHASLSEMATLVRQVERSCAKAGIDPSEHLGNVGAFLNGLKDNPASTLIPDEANSSDLAMKVKVMIASLMRLFHKSDVEEDEGPSPA